MRLKAGLWTSLLLMLTFGCRTYTVFLKPDEQHTIDRGIVDYPPSCELKEFAHNLNCPTGFCVDQDGTWFYIEGGISNQPLHIFGRRADGSILEIYPAPTRVPFINKNFKIHGPVGGIAAANGKVFVSHRDENDMGVITTFGYDGSHSTIVSEFPAQGDYGITDITISPGGAKLYFGVGPATNSGVVGIDNWTDGWLKKHPDACDVSPVDLKLYGLKFTSSNPLAGIFGGGNDTAVTAPFQPFNVNDRTRIKKAPNGKANSAIYSISLTGGDLVLECYGIRLPRGLGVLDYACYATNDGMEMRGTRPIKDDPDAFIKTAPDAWFGFPDFSTDLFPVSDARFQPPSSLLNHGYPSIDPLIDKDNSGPSQRLVMPNRSDYVFGVFPSNSGAAKFDFIPENSTVLPYKRFRGQAIVALSGDRAPFATGGSALGAPIGGKVVSVDTEKKKASDFIYNTRGLPASKLGHDVVALERPCDVKLGPDGALYVLDMGRFEMEDGRIKVAAHTGRIFKLIPIVEPERPAAK
ncbi:MAG TPA: hypothetical protein VHS31_13340 [Tepidisphaeraceae bacterium]|jgi:hypothetical protein|nr:hypothetical protein [Tepidisphaeraceae bacterium]